MFTQAELDKFINNPPTYVEVDFTVEMAKQLLQEKQLNAELTRECNDAVSLLS